MGAIPLRLLSMPGVQRDGTRFASKNYLDAQWCRFQRGRPRKMGGYLSVAQNLPDLTYGLHSFSANDTQYVHAAGTSAIVQRLIDSSGALLGSNNRTPAGYAGGSASICQFDVFFDVNLGNLLIAHPAPNMDISQTNDFDIYQGVVTAAGILAATGQDPVSGGIVVVGNYLVSFGNDGYVGWSAQNDVMAATLDSQNVTQQKIVVGKRVRGGGVPAALLWSLDSLIQMTFNDPTGALWDFDTITDQTSILSTRGVIEYDGEFYWPGVDRFLSYNGVVRELPNQMNANFFFDNLNFAQRQKVFAYKVPRFGEIWWCFPYGNSTECNHAVIYNIREKTWYDTPLPDGGRTDGLYASVYFKPFMTGIEEGPDGYDLWQHETGVNRSRLGVNLAIQSFFETHEMAVINSESEPQNKALRIERMEPDYIQAGDLQLQVKGRANARATVNTIATQTITPVAADAQEQTVPLKNSARLMSFRFESNVEDGNYQMGEVLGHIEPSDSRMTQ